MKRPYWAATLWFPRGVVEFNHTYEGSQVTRRLFQLIQTFMWIITYSRLFKGLILGEPLHRINFQMFEMRLVSSARCPAPFHRGIFDRFTVGAISS